MVYVSVFVFLETAIETHGAINNHHIELNSWTMYTIKKTLCKQKHLLQMNSLLYFFFSSSPYLGLWQNAIKICNKSLCVCFVACLFSKKRLFSCVDAFITMCLTELYENRREKRINCLARHSWLSIMFIIFIIAIIASLTVENVEELNFTESQYE